MQRYKKSSISRGNVPFLGRFPRLIDTFLLIAEDFLLIKLQVGGPVEYEKQLEQLLQLVTTYTLRVSQSCCMVNNTIPRFAWDIPADCPYEALFIVVKVVQVVFLTQQAVLEPIQLLQFVTTLSISLVQNRARSSFAMARKGAMKWNASPWTFLPIVLAKRCS